MAKRTTSSNRRSSTGRSRAAAASRGPSQHTISADVRPASLPTPQEDLLERRFDRIARRAFEIYQARGGEHGQALEDWLQAEREIDAETEPPLDEDDEE